MFFFNVKSSTVLEINLPFWRKKSISALIKVNSLYSNSFLYLTMHEIRELYIDTKVLSYKTN